MRWSSGGGGHLFPLLHDQGGGHVGPLRDGAGRQAPLLAHRTESLVGVRAGDGVRPLAAGDLALDLRLHVCRSTYLVVYMYM